MHRNALPILKLWRNISHTRNFGQKWDAKFNSYSHVPFNIGARDNKLTDMLKNHLLLYSGLILYSHHYLCQM